MLPREIPEVEEEPSVESDDDEPEFMEDDEIKYNCTVF